MAVIIKRINKLNEEVEFSYADGAYTVSLVKEGRAFKGVSNCYAYAQTVFEMFVVREVNGKKEESGAEVNNPPLRPLPPTNM